MTKSKTKALSAPIKTTAEAAPLQAGSEAKAPKGKLGILVGLLQRPEGVSLQAAQEATGWQAHSVRGAFAGSIKKKLGLNLVSEKTEAGRVYRIQIGEAQ